MRIKHSKGFTLIELLVVISIIALLVSIMLPTLSKARDNSKRTACRALLTGVGRAVELYRGQYNSYPWAREISTVVSSQEQYQYLSDVPISKAMAEFAEEKQFKCPADNGPLGDTDASKKIRDEFGTQYYTYFDRERTSYDYMQIFQMEQTNPGRVANRVDSRMLLMTDFEPFHGPRNTFGSCNYLFGDGHVSDMIDSSGN